MSCRMVEGEIYYDYEGCIKEVVDRGAEKINTGEIEEAIMSHPAVVACAVVGVKDRTLGEQCVHTSCCAKDIKLQMSLTWASTWKLMA
ncbi:hypothetical protein [Polynucleobacter sp.]|uniref:AMP-binding enzyme n=1 Tax=Polynucleobacter sp. TaxID=2029855 RepID=UPI00351D35CF